VRHGACNSQALVRVDPVLVVATALLLGACAAVAPLPVAVGAGASLLLLRSRMSRLGWLLGLLALVLSSWRAHWALGDFEAARVAARDALMRPARCAGRAVVVRSPTWAHGSANLVVDLHQGDCEGRPLPSPVRARVYGGPDDLARGDQLELVAKLAPVRLFRNHGLGDPTPLAVLRGYVLSGPALAIEVGERGRGWRAAVDAARAHARRRIVATFSPAVAAMARALVLGENDLAPEEDKAFKLSGLAHILAVSGTHLVFAVVAVVQALRFVLVRIERLAARYDVARAAAALGAVLALAYADYAGGSGSAWRAAWMLCAAFGARAFGRQTTGVRVLGVSLLVGAVLHPLAAFDLSLLLSAAATTGLLTLGRPWARRWRRLHSRALRYVALSVVATTSSMLPCAPLLALLSGRLTVAGVFANVIAMPFGELIALPLCLAHALLGALPALERGVALVASGALLVVKKVALASAATQALAFNVPVPGGWHLCVGGVAVVGAWAAVGRIGPGGWRAARVSWAGAALLGLGLVEWAQVRVHRPVGVLRVMAVDVGQGDATLIDLPDGSLLLVDGGGLEHSPVDPGRSVILPLLRARRRDRIDIAVLTHPHPDHVMGLATALEAVEVGQFWDTGQGEAEGAGPAYHRLLSELRRRAVPIVRPAELCKTRSEHAGARISVLGPCPTFVRGVDQNNNSLVLRIEYGQRAVLLVGDAEAAEEARLLRAHGPGLRADLLKVGHHGSDSSSTTQFLRAVRPELASISCGVRNRFGHPHPAALARLVRAGALPVRLDRAGSVLWRTDAQRASARAFAHVPAEH
jgi:competence protein ComEC